MESSIVYRASAQNGPFVAFEVIAMQKLYLMTHEFLGFCKKCRQPSQMCAKEMWGTPWVYSLGHEYTDSYDQGEIINFVILSQIHIKIYLFIDLY